MQELKPTVGVEFANEYDEAKRKFFDFITAINKLTPEQNKRLFEECVSVTGSAALVQQFMDFMKSRGNQ